MNPVFVTVFRGLEEPGFTRQQAAQICEQVVSVRKRVAAQRKKLGLVVFIAQLQQI